MKWKAGFFAAAVLLVAAMSTMPISAAAASEGNSTKPRSEAALASRLAALGQSRGTAVQAVQNGGPTTFAVAGGSDPAGDTSPISVCNGDIVSYGASYTTSAAAMWEVSACGSDPVHSVNWTQGLTGIIWFIDVNGDGFEDYEAFFDNTGALDGSVFHTANGDFTQVCSGTPAWDGNAAFSNTFSPSCIGSPSAFRVHVGMVWDENPLGSTCFCPTDHAPDSGLSPLVVKTTPPPPPPPPPVAHWYERDTASAGAADAAFTYGLRGYFDVAGDWTGSGVQGPGVFDSGSWYLRNTNTAGSPDTVVNYGAPGYTPVAGDWDGNGTDTIGVFLNGNWYLRDSNTPGSPDVVVNYGAAGYTPVVGDWDGNGTDTIGVYVDGWWYLRNSNTPGPPDIVVHYGAAGYTPVVGDWDGNNTDTIGVYVNGAWYLRNANSGGNPDLAFNYGAPGYRPIVGKWTPGTVDGIGVLN